MLNLNIYELDIIIENVVVWRIIYKGNFIMYNLVINHRLMLCNYDNVLTLRLGTFKYEIINIPQSLNIKTFSLLHSFSSSSSLSA